MTTNSESAHLLANNKINPNKYTTEYRHTALLGYTHTLDVKVIAPISFKNVR